MNGDAAEMTAAELAQKYGVNVKRVKWVGVARLNAMSEEARALMLPASREHIPNSRVVRSQRTRIAREFAQRKAARWATLWVPERPDKQGKVA